MLDTIQLNIDPTGQWDKLTVTQFEIKFKQLYQVLTRNLDGVFTEYHNVEGHSVTVPVMEAFMLVDRGAFSSVVPNKEVGIGRVSFDLTTKAAKAPIDIVLEKEIKANIVSSLAEQAAGAVKRVEDQFVLNALKDASALKTDKNAPVVNTIEVAKTDAFKIDHLIETKVTLDSLGIPSTNRHFVAPASLQKNLLLTNQVTNADYAAVKALVYGEINQFLGFKFHWIPNMPEGGMPEGGVAYAFHQNDGAQAWGVASRIEMYYDHPTMSNVINAMVHGNAKVLTPKHMVCIKYKTA
jgi:hypothetical protein